MLRIYCFASCWILYFMHFIMLTLAHIQPFYALAQVHTEPVSKVQAEQAQVEAITNLVWIKVSPSAFNHAPCLLILIFTLCSVVVVHYKFIGVVWHRSCIKIMVEVE
jgi:hypothetical protein